MNVTRSTETRTVQHIRYVSVTNIAVLDTAAGVTILSSGVSRVKVVKLAKGGYSVRPLGPNAVQNFWRDPVTTYTNGEALLRVDDESHSIAYLFKD